MQAAILLELGLRVSGDGSCTVERQIASAGGCVCKMRRRGEVGYFCKVVVVR